MKVNVKNQIARVILITLSYISVVVLLIPAIPYAMIKRAGNSDYYDEWFDFIKEYIPL